MAHVMRVSHRNRPVFRLTLHLVLTGVLLGCPFLCFASCPLAASVGDVAVDQAKCCCGHASESPPCEESPDPPTRGEEDPQCDCLCEGAVYDSRTADLGLDGAVWRSESELQRVAVTPGQSRTTAAASDDARPDGTGLRALLSSWLC